ncbi:hypothetical protein PEL8287_00796 [Roseovarius litorisediminis]|uniref:DUF1643 domain-containing protein n=1 Tax=Roseovarius litorisediminis TaxID=1312363 RepID=A0A1Y5RPB7_9RHOB|nr:DUF1643 domain-containing protein [Roseovarius litorisediminis]SLN19505.1 hypothetical protein PEL8287_00796 [Roseovarius litorisediminis]
MDISGNAPASDPSSLHDPGGKVRLKLPDGVIGGATFSACGRYRQSLSRDWTPEGQMPRQILFVGMNPSVAGAEVSDPTCHRELGFAQRWGYTRYLKGNMLDWRATSPKDIPADPAVACSPANIPALVDMTKTSEIVVLAYGKLHQRFQPIVREVLDAIQMTGRPLYCLGLNKDGSAKHPLYLRKDTDLIDFPRSN